MSSIRISRSSDLSRLRDDGFDIEVKDAFLLVKQIPYVNHNREIKRGVLVTNLSLADNVTVRPKTHVVYFIGEQPCDSSGIEIAGIKHNSNPRVLTKGLEIQHSFSCKPKEGYTDYHDKMTTYANLICGPASFINPSVSARVSSLQTETISEEVFMYADSASSTAGIVEVGSRLALDKLAIVGLGETGAYVLDLVSKTPVKEIHLFDGDQFLQRNAFRSPGAASGQDLGLHKQKVEYFKHLYSRMHRHIHAHDHYIDATNVEVLAEMDFVFLCVDSGAARKLIVEKLEEYEVNYVDVGMGVELEDGMLAGILRVTTSTAETRQHKGFSNTIPFVDLEEADAYSQRIQIADLNALNAALAVIKWKKLCGFYRDLDNEHVSAYVIDGNSLINESKIGVEAHAIA